MLSSINRKSVKIAAFVGAVMAAGLAARPASAALTLTLSEPGFGPVTTTDVGNTGIVQFAGQYGDFKTNIDIGFSNKTTGLPGDPSQLQIQALDITNTATVIGPRVLTVTLSDDGYTFPGVSGSTVQLSSSMGGTINNANAGDSVVFTSSAQPSNATPGPQPFVATSGFSSFNMPVATTTFVRGASFNLTSTTVISLSNTNETTNLSGTTTVSAVPEPASMSVLGLAGIALIVRRRKA